MNNIRGAGFLLSTVLFQELYRQHRISLQARLIFSCIYVEGGLYFENSVRHSRVLMPWWRSFCSPWQALLKPLTLFAWEGEYWLNFSPPHTVPSQQSGLQVLSCWWGSIILERKTNSFGIAWQRIRIWCFQLSAGVDGAHFCPWVLLPR